MADATGQVTGDVSVDSTIIRAHQHAVGARKGDLEAEPPGGVVTEPDDHALGRSRGGRTTKLHLGGEQGRKPLSIVLTAGQHAAHPRIGRDPDAPDDRHRPCRAATSSGRAHQSQQAAACRAELFAAHGPEVSLNEVTGETGVEIATLQRNFASRDDLVAAVLLERMVQYTDAAADDPRLAFRDFVERVCRMQLED